MKFHPRLRVLPLPAILAAVMAGPAAYSQGTGQGAGQGADRPDIPAAELTRIVKDLDRQHFEAFNGCDLKTLESLYAPDAEFYHDLNGRVRSREQLLAAIGKNTCGKVRRRLIESSLEVYPMAGFGAIERGRHCFHEVGQSACVQEGQFFMLWKFDGQKWQLSRVISYDHKALP